MSYSILEELPSTTSPKQRGKAGQEELRLRLLSSLERLLDLVSQSTVSRALSAPTAFDSLALMLDGVLKERPQLALLDRQLASHLELVDARRAVLERAGGTYTTAQAAELLGITPEAVRKRVQRGSLLSYQTPSGEHRLPRAQFTSSGVIEGLSEVLQAMHVREPWMKIQLFLDRDVVGALEDGRVDDAVRAAASYLVMDEE